MNRGSQKSAQHPKEVLSRPMGQSGCKKTRDVRRLSSRAHRNLSQLLQNAWSKNGVFSPLDITSEEPTHFATFFAT